MTIEYSFNQLNKILSFKLFFFLKFWNWFALVFSKILMLNQIFNAKFFQKYLF